MARRQALDDVDLGAHDLWPRREDLAGREAFPHARQPAAWPRLGGTLPMARRFEPRRVLQVRCRLRRNRREDPADRRRPGRPRPDNLERHAVVLRRHRRGLQDDDLKLTSSIPSARAADLHQL